MPYFLTRKNLYRLIQKELPPDAYPDGAPSAFFSTADSDATAAVFATIYAQNERIYENFFPQTADEKITDQEIKYFGQNLDSALSLEERRARIITKIRTRRRTTPADLKATVQTVIGTDKLVDIIEWNCASGAWVLDYSMLDVTTILNGFNGVGTPTGPDLCEKDAADFGLTEEEFAELKAEAYTYEVAIYGYTLTAQELAALEAELQKAEPSRSRRIITDGLDPADMIGGDT